MSDAKAFELNAAVQPLLVAPLLAAAPLISGDRRQRQERRRRCQPIHFAERRSSERRATALQAYLWSSRARR